MPRTATGSPSVCRVMASRKLYTAEQAAAVVVSGSSDESSDEASSSDEFSQNEGPMSSSRTPLSEIQTNFIGSRTRSGSSAKNIPKDFSKEAPSSKKMHCVLRKWHSEGDNLSV